MMVVSSLLFAREKHEGQTRIGGEPYIEHPIAVANILKMKGFTDPKYIITAFFHDILEDTDATEAEILFYGGDEVLEAVKVLTKTKGYDMKEYVADVGKIFLAKMVKLADRLHNLRCAVVADENFRRRYIKETEKYYLNLAKGTIFELDILSAFYDLKRTVDNKV